MVSYRSSRILRPFLLVIFVWVIVFAIAVTIMPSMESDPQESSIWIPKTVTYLMAAILLWVNSFTLIEGRMEGETVYLRSNLVRYEANIGELSVRRFFRMPHSIMGSSGLIAGHIRIRGTWFGNFLVLTVGEADQWAGQDFLNDLRNQGVDSTDI